MVEEVGGVPLSGVRSSDDRMERGVFSGDRERSLSALFNVSNSARPALAATDLVCATVWRSDLG